MSEIAAALAMGLVFLAAAIFTGRKAAASPAWRFTVPAVWLIAFLVRSLVFSVLIGPTNEGAFPEFASRFVASVLALFVWAGLITYYLSLRDYYRQISMDLTQSTARLRQLSHLKLNDLSELRDQLGASVEYSIQPVVRGLEEQLSTLTDRSTQGELLALAEMAGEHSRKLVRDVSHQISQGQAPLEGPAFAAVDLTINDRPGMPWRISLTWGPAIFVATILAPATGIGLPVAGRIVVGVLTWSVVMLCLRRLHSLIIGRWHVPSLIYVIAANAIAVILGFAVTMIAFAGVSVSTVAPMGGPVAFLFLGATGLLAGLLPSALDRNIASMRHASEMLAAQNAKISQLTRYLDESTARLRRQVSEILHGPVQGRLSGVAMSLRLYVEAQRAGDSSSSTEVVDRCRGLLQQVNDDINRVLNGSLDHGDSVGERLELLRSRWKGIVDVGWRLSTSAAESLNAYPTLGQQVCSIIEEGINNACSHGRSRSVDVIGEITEMGLLELQIVDDGHGPVEPMQPGMGLREIEAAGGVWQLSRRGASGARLSVLLPLPTVTPHGAASNAAV